MYCCIFMLVRGSQIHMDSRLAAGDFMIPFLAGLGLVLSPVGLESALDFSNGVSQLTFQIPGLI